MGARRVVVCDISDAALIRAKKVGADEVINPTQTDVVEAVKSLTDGEGAHVVIEAVGGLAPTFASAVRMVAPNGTLGIIGSYKQPQTLDIEEALSKQMQITFIHAYGAWEGVPEFKIALDMMVSGQFHPLEIITHRLPLEEIATAFETAANKVETGAGKVLILP